MNDQHSHRILGVESGSIADQLGIVAGDKLELVNNLPVSDVFAYRTAMLAEEIVLSVVTAQGPMVFEIEKDEEEDLGLIFENALMDDCESCHNRCVFCFIDQLPSGMRSSLYFKDDDLRLSFLEGNYVTLTNLSDTELDRLIGYRLSPMNISVHAISPDVRKAMMNNRFAGDIFARLRRIVENRISVNAQIVLCSGINDGDVLEETLVGLVGLGERLLSVSVVPVGLTRYRDANRLQILLPYGPDSAGEVLDAVQGWQEKLLAERGSRTVYASDEFYLRAGRPLPEAEEYEDFPQLENGVGMAALFDREMNEGIACRTSAAENFRADAERPGIHAVTGADFAPLLDRHADAIRSLYGLRWTTHAVRNEFFGNSITVAGLVTAGDILTQLAPSLRDDPRGIVLIPANMLRAEGDIFLDDWTPARLQEELRAKVIVCGSTAPELLSVLDRIATGEEPL